MLLEKTPLDYGIDRNLWTAKVMIQVIKQKWNVQLKTLMSTLEIEPKIQVEFFYTPSYSPDFNLAEYIIHLLRLRFLHHLPLNVTIEQIEQKLSNYFLSHQLQTPQQIKNTIRHICHLVG